MESYRDLSRYIAQMLTLAAAIVGAGYVGTLWQLSKDQSATIVERDATIAEYKAMGEQRVIDCSLAQDVAECSAANPGQRCVTTAGAK